MGAHLKVARPLNDFSLIPCRRRNLRDDFAGQNIAGGEGICPKLYILVPLPFKRNDHILATVKDAMPALVGRCKPLSIDILGIIYEDTGACGGVLNRQTGNIRVFEAPAKDVEAKPAEVGIYVAGDFVCRVPKVAA